MDDALELIESQMMEECEIACDLRFRYTQAFISFAQIDLGSLFIEIDAKDRVYIKATERTAFCISEPDDEAFDFFDSDSCHLVYVMDV